MVCSVCVQPNSLSGTLFRVQPEFNRSIRKERQEYVRRASIRCRKAGGASKPVATGEPGFRDYRMIERLRPIIKASTAQAIELGSGTAVVSAAVRRPMKGVMSRLSGRSLMSISAAA